MTQASLGKSVVQKEIHAAQITVWRQILPIHNLCGC